MSNQTPNKLVVTTRPPENPTFAQTVYVNGDDPNTATEFSLDTPIEANDPTLAQDSDNLYIGEDASIWVWDGGANAYVTYEFPANVKRGVYATFNTNQTFSSGSSTFFTNMSTIQTTAGGDWNRSLGEFTVSRAGWYAVDAMVRMSISGSYTANRDIFFRIMRNGVVRAQTYERVPNSTTNYSPPTISVSQTIYLSVGDKVRVNMIQSTGATRSLFSVRSNYFSIAEI